MYIKRFASIQELSEYAAGLVNEQANVAVKKNGVFSLVLTGGRSPRTLYELLAASPYKTSMPWQQTHVFWGDDRAVAPNNEASNFKLAHETMLTKIDIPQENIWRMKGELGAEAAATEYEQNILTFYEKYLPLQGDSTIPQFDFVLLGMGEDGHIASLFPGQNHVQEKSRLITAISEPSGTPPVPRISMTLPLLNRAKRIIMLISGEKKKKIVEEIEAKGRKAGPPYPAALLEPQEKLLWFVVE